jgi:mono/diheme cytochrome c family protein
MNRAPMPTTSPMPRPSTPVPRGAGCGARAGLALSFSLLAAVALAPAHADGGRLMPRTVPEVYTQECASCHLAYPPGLLPAASWQRLMGGLDRHYGSDASLDAATRAQIDSWLRVFAGTYKRVSEPPPQDRITRSAWFERKHRQIDPSVWKLPSVKGAAQCAACHDGAERGDFDDDDLKMPAGLDARLRRPWND